MSGVGGRSAGSDTCEEVPASTRVARIPRAQDAREVQERLLRGRLCREFMSVLPAPADSRLHIVAMRRDALR
jgi:hypothetical protein